MPNPTRTWQLASLILACALIAALVQLHQRPTANAPKGTLPTVNNISGYEHLALSPNARRTHERFSL
ncbi:putative membrane protein [Pseudomonas reidholzensis]|uniref:Putative membrane protein n=1 Tax=Pseudomonas reidholzensis TaxID=1785162 RepID=A0A383RSZ8_9PSED|nr:putative membrane protein [Pseudomonas reidholzensis]